MPAEKQETTGKVIKTYSHGATSGILGEPVYVWEVEPDYEKVNIEKMLTTIGQRHRVRVTVEEIES